MHAFRHQKPTEVASEVAKGPQSLRPSGALVWSSFLVALQGGMEVVAEVRQRWPDARICMVAITADAFEETRTDCLRSGFDAWLAKPFRIEQLAQIMDSVYAQTF